MMRRLVLLAVLGGLPGLRQARAQPTPAPAPAGPVVSSAELQAAVLPDALFVAVLDLRLVRGSGRLQELWRAMTLAQPDLPTQLVQLEAGLGMKLGQDLDAIVLSGSQTGAVLAFIGRLPEEPIVAAARGEKLEVSKDAASAVPLYLAKPEAGDALALAFPRRALLLGPEADVRATLGSPAPRQAAALAAAGGPHLLSFALCGVDRLLAEEAKASGTPQPAPEDAAARALQKLSSLSLALDLDKKLELSLQAGFSVQDAAAALHQAFSQALGQAAAAQDASTREMLQAVRLGLDGSNLTLAFGLTAAQTGRISRDAQRGITATEATHAETGLKLHLPRLPHAWTLQQPEQDQFGSYWKAALPKGDGFLRVQSWDLSQETGWTLEKEAEGLVQRLQKQKILVNRFIEAGGSRAHLVEAEEGLARHRYEQFAKDGKLYLLIGSSAEGPFRRLGEEMDFLVAQVLEPPAQAETSSDDSMTALLKASRDLQLQQLRFQTMSNILRMQHETSMSIIYNMGGGWRYEYR